MRFLRTWIRHAPHAPRKVKARLNLETLESRVVPYNVSGNAWPHPELITISFVPDGTYVLSNEQSNLFATFNARWPTATWEGQILKAAQQWAAATNINFAVIPDNGAPGGSGLYQQGDPGMGDIRIGGYNFGTGDLAGADMPPPVNNFSIAGDISFNTAQPFNIGTTYDLYSVAMHEFGHALGLLHSTAYGAVMNAAYQKRTGLGTDDVAGVRAIYSSGGARSTDAYLGLNSTILTATPVSIDPNTLTGQLNNLNLASAGQSEYFSFSIPQGTNGTLTATVQSAGLSMLAPTLTLYNGLSGQVGFTSGAGQDGTTISVKLTGVSAGQVYYAKVTGADTSAFSTGAYSLTLNTGPGPSPTVPLPNTQTPNGNPLHAGGGLPEVAGNVGIATILGYDTFNPNEGNTVNTYVPGGTYVPVSTYVASSQPLRPVTLPTANLSDAAPTAIPRIESRIESGGGGTPEATADLTLPAKMPPASDPGDAAPVRAPVPNDTAIPQTFSSRAGWQEACTACFASEPVQGQTQDDAGSGLALGKGESNPAFDPAATLVGSMLVLGGYWGSQVEQIPESRRRKGLVP
jgi:hypothetical protein